MPSKGKNGVRVLEQFLRQNFSFSEDAVDEAMVRFCERRVQKKEFLLEAGQVCREFYFVVEGGARVFFVTEKGQEKTHFIGLENSVVTALSSFIEQQPAQEFIEAIEDSVFLAISHSDFFYLVNTSRSWERFYRKVLETAYLAKARRIDARVSLSALERFRLLLSERPEFFQRVSNRVLSSYIDMSEETLSRLKTEYLKNTK